MVRFLDFSKQGNKEVADDLTISQVQTKEIVVMRSASSSKVSFIRSNTYVSSIISVCLCLFDRECNCYGTSPLWMAGIPQ